MRGFVLVLAASVCCGLTVSLGFPAVRSVLGEEDRALETVTVVLHGLVIASALFGLASARVRSRRGALLCSLAAAFCVLEEISYGERLIGFAPPWVFGVKIDSAHDLVFLVVKVAKDALREPASLSGARALLLVLASGTLVACGVLAYRSRARIAQSVGRATRTSWFFFLVSFLVLGVTAMLLDLAAVPLETRSPLLHDAVQLLEELLEANAALALLLGCQETFRG